MDKSIVSSDTGICIYNIHLCGYADSGIYGSCLALTQYILS